MRIAKLLIGLLLLCVACDKSVKETPNGMKFRVVKTGEGEPTKVGDVLMFNFIFKDSKDSVWRSTYEADFPQFIVMPDTVGISREDGMTQMLRMLTKGDSVLVTIPIKDFYKDYARQPVPPETDSTLTLTFQFKAENIMQRDSFMIYQQEFYAKKQKAQQEKDSLEIESYLVKNNITAQKTESGLYYVITKPGKGENGKPEQIAAVNYVGYTLKGEYFDSNIKTIAIEKGFYSPQREPYGPMEVTIDRSGVIKGWHDALKVLNEGAEATIFVPSRLAWGPQQRSEIIKANEIVVFELEVVSFKEKR